MSTDPLGRGEKFLSRWSRRKQAEPESREREDARVDDELAAQRGLPARSETLPPGKEPADLPSIESLTPSSDFTRFMRADVPSSARNAAMKKLFGDPHFNVMDGLDIYIDDYTKSDPIPLAMLRDLAQSRMLRLFDYEDEKAAEPASAAPAAAPVADSAPAEAMLPQPGNAPADMPATDQPKPAAGSVD